MIVKTTSLNEIPLTEEEQLETQTEAFIPVKNDRVYAFNRQYIIICMLDSVVPRKIGTLDPDYLAGGISEFTFNQVKEYFTYSPLARKFQLPFHFYTEIFQDEYISLVGSPLTSSSWYLEYLVKERILDPIYQDSILICLQENYSNELLEKKLMETLAHTLVTPLMREHKFGYRNVVFLENIINREMLDTNKYYYHIKEPIYLHEKLFHVFLKKFIKR